jgi:hypothetical protein
MKGKFVTRHGERLTSYMVAKNAKNVKPSATMQALAIG